MNRNSEQAVDYFIRFLFRRLAHPNSKSHNDSEVAVPHHVANGKERIRAIKRNYNDEQIKDGKAEHEECDSKREHHKRRQRVVDD